MSYNIQPCGGLLEGPQTQILSPGYPAEYPASSHCQWIIEFTEGSQIQFTANAFSVARCRPVLLDVHMPPPTYMPPLYRCQYASPHPALARQTISPFGMDLIPTPLFSGPAVAPLSLPISCRCRTRFSNFFLPSLDGPSQVLAEFVSDQSGSSTGFNITATEHTTGCGGILHGMVSQHQATISWFENFVFGRILEEHQQTTFVSVSLKVLLQGGLITSPRNTGSVQYPDSTECIWEIRTDPGYHIEVKCPDISNR